MSSITEYTDGQLEAARVNARNRTLVMGKQCSYYLLNKPYHSGLAILAELNEEQQRRLR